MQLLIIFGPSNQVKSISISKAHIIFSIVTLMAMCICVAWACNSISSVVDDALQFHGNKERGVEGFPLHSEGAYELRLMQLKLRLDSLQRKVNKLNHLKPEAFNSYEHALDLSSQSESYGVRLDRVFGDSIVLDARLVVLATNLNATPLPVPLQTTSVIGYRVDPFTHQVASHKGVDFQAAYGTPILATAPGVVLRAAWDDQYGYVVEIQHPNSVITRYAHANILLVKQGELVGQSQMIARVGSTGRSTGPHLHYEVIKNGKYLAKG